MGTFSYDGIMKINDVIINLKLLKLYGFYQMFDPTCPKIYDRNAYLLLLIVITFFSQLIFVFGTLGFFIEMEDKYSPFEVVFYLYALMHTSISLWKLWIIFYNADKIWKLFDVTKLNFLWSENKNINTLYKSRYTNIRLTNLYFISSIMIFVIWKSIPLVTYMFTTLDEGQRNKNIINLRFPVTVSFYNQNFLMFYMLEWLSYTNIIYIMIVTETFFISFCYAIIGQYKSLEEAAKQIGHEDELKIGNFRNYFCP